MAVVRGLVENGFDAIAVVADVAERALRPHRYLDQQCRRSEEDGRRLFDTNFRGRVHGSLAALPHLARQGGALIKLGSEASEVAIPMRGMYSASKHVWKGFTDALRIEVEHMDGACRCARCGSA